MSAERWRGQIKNVAFRGARIALASSVLFLASDTAPPQHLVSLAKFSGARGALAAGLGDPSREISAQESQIPKELLKRKIVFKSFDRDGAQIFVSNLDGSERRQLTHGQGGRDYPVWLDENTIIYSFEWYGSPKRGLTVIDLTSGEVRQITRPGEKEGDIQPRAAGTKIVFVRMHVPGSTDLYSVRRDGSDLTRLTQDDDINAEILPVITPDGKLVAYHSHSTSRSPNPHPAGMVIQELSVLKDTFDPDYRPIFIEGAKPLAWSPDGQKLLYSIQETVGKEGWDILWMMDRDGKNKIRLAQGVYSASWSPDGNWIVASLQEAPGLKYPPYPHLISLSGGKPKKLFDTVIQGVDLQPETKPPVEKIEQGRQVILVSGLTTEIRDGVLTSGTFDPLIERLEGPEFKYRQGTSLLLFSRGGWRVDEDGRVLVKDQSCEDTLRGQDYEGSTLLQFLLDLQNRDPGVELTIIAHSWGGDVVLRALELIKERGLEVNLTGMQVRIVQSPILGQSKSGLAELASIVPVELPESCRNILGTPSPAVANYSTVVELLDMWRNRLERIKEISQLVAWLKGRGVSIIAFANWGDCVISPSSCLLDRDILQLWLFRGRIWPILSQELPGGQTIWLDVHGLDSLGHHAFFHGEGLDILASTISPQTKSFAQSR